MSTTPSSPGCLRRHLALRLPRADHRYRLILPLDSHPLVTHAESRVPSTTEIDFILAGPGGRYPTEEDAAADEVARLSLHPAPRPEYIM